MNEDWIRKGFGWVYNEQCTIRNAKIHQMNLERRFIEYSAYLNNLVQKPKTLSLWKLFHTIHDLEGCAVGLSNFTIGTQLVLIHFCSVHKRLDSISFENPSSSIETLLVKQLDGPLGAIWTNDEPRPLVLALGLDKHNSPFSLYSGSLLSLPLLSLALMCRLLLLTPCIVGPFGALAFVATLWGFALRAREVATRARIFQAITQVKARVKQNSLRQQESRWVHLYILHAISLMHATLLS